MSEDEVEALVEAALSIGINTFDLADIYGDGQCRSLLGKVPARSDSEPDVDPNPSVGFAKTALPILIFEGLYFDLSIAILDRLQIERLDSLLLHRSMPYGA